MRQMAGLALRDGLAGADAGGAEHGWITPVEALRALRRHAWLILLCGLVFGGAAYAWAALTLPRKFTATASIVVETRGYAIPELQGALSSDAMADVMPMVRSEVQELSSRAQIQGVIDALHLADDPEFNPTLRPPTAKEEVKAWLGTHLPDWAASPLAEIGLATLHPLSGPMPPTILATFSSPPRAIFL